MKLCKKNYHFDHGMSNARICYTPWQVLVYSSHESCCLFCAAKGSSITAIILASCFGYVENSLKTEGNLKIVVYEDIKTPER